MSPIYNDLINCLLRVYIILSYLTLFIMVSNKFFIIYFFIYLNASFNILIVLGIIYEDNNDAIVRKKRNIEERDLDKMKKRQTSQNSVTTYRRKLFDQGMCMVCMLKNNFE